jgi:hypothetical protein
MTMKKKIVLPLFCVLTAILVSVGIGVEMASAVTIENHTMCKDTESRIATIHNSTGYAPLPIDETTEFYLTDSEAICWVQIERINRGDTFRFEWYNPSDLFYQLNNSTTDPYFECWKTIYSNVITSHHDLQGYYILDVGFVNISLPILGFDTCWLSSSLKIDGYPPANVIGNWHVDFYYNDEKQFTETFTISETLPASGAPTSGRWIGTTSQGKNVSFIVGDTQVYNFTISYDFSCTGSRGSGTIKNNIPIDIVENAFQYEYHLPDDRSRMYGEFTTSNSATGTFRKTWTQLYPYPYEDTCDSGNITWSAGRVQTTGDININEIMYNPPGLDRNREWIELFNGGPEDINITGWKFFEYSTDSYHVFTRGQGSMVIPTGKYAIIAVDAPTFLNEHPMCNCTVIESGFWLSNTGESIALKDASSAIIDEVSYYNSWGASGNGKTLELNITGGWEESLVDRGTPCQQNSVLAVDYSGE